MLAVGGLEGFGWRAAASSVRTRDERGTSVRISRSIQAEAGMEFAFMLGGESELLVVTMPSKEEEQLTPIESPNPQLHGQSRPGLPFVEICLSVSLKPGSPIRLPFHIIWYSPKITVFESTSMPSLDIFEHFVTGAVYTWIHPSRTAHEQASHAAVVFPEVLDEDRV